MPKYRGRGLFKVLVKYRIDKARRRGAKLAVCLARRRHSAPVVKRLGFIAACTIPVYYFHPSRVLD